MDQKVLKDLIKNDMLNSIWIEIDKLVSNSSKYSPTQFSQQITGNHSWYTDARNKREDIRLTSLVRVMAQLNSENILNDRIQFEKMFSEAILKKGELLSYLTSTKEEQSQLPELIKQHQKVFLEIRSNLAPLYREGDLDKRLTLGYEQLEALLQEIGGRKDG